MYLMFLFLLQVKIWFQNHRYKCKRASKERQSASCHESEKSAEGRSIKSETKDPETDSLVDPNESDGVPGSPLNEDNFVHEQAKSVLNYSTHSQQTATVQPAVFPPPQTLQLSSSNGPTSLDDVTRCSVVPSSLSVVNGGYPADTSLSLFPNTLGSRAW